MTVRRLEGQCHLATILVVSTHTHNLLRGILRVPTVCVTGLVARSVPSTRVTIDDGKGVGGRRTCRQGSIGRRWVGVVKEVLGQEGYTICSLLLRWNREIGDTGAVLEPSVGPERKRAV